MNLREGKHWSYGATSLIVDAKGQRMYIVFSSVQGDKTSDSMREVQKELQGITGDKPPTAEEFAKTQSDVVLGLPGSWETIGRVAASVEQIVQYGLPDTYFKEYPARIQAMQAEAVQDAAKRAIKPGSLVWVIVGDKAKIEESIKALGFGDIKCVDADGNLL